MSVAREIRQTRPFTSIQQEAFVSLLRTADVLRWRLSEVVEPEGLSLPQYNILRILRGARPAGLPTLEIRARMVEQAPGITRLIDRLESEGLVRRERTPDDRRRVLCHISPKGLALLSRLDATVPEATDVLFTGLRVSDVQTLLGTLALIRTSSAARCASLRKH